MAPAVNETRRRRLRAVELTRGSSPGVLLSAAPAIFGRNEATFTR
jgi:hypothetical protein